MAIKVPCSSPKSQLWLQTGNWREQWPRLERKINEHPFNHAVELIIPGIECLPPAVSSSLPPPSFFTASLPVGHFIQPDIINRYLLLNEGSLTALSVGKRIDVDDVYALLPSGKLVLSLIKDTYEQLGLQGSPSRYQKKYRYVVEVDLKAAHFKPGKANYERVKQCLNERLNQKVDFILSWTNQGAIPTAESQFLKDFKATKINCESNTEILKDFPLPILQAKHPHGLIEGGDTISCSATELHTWIGAVACGLDVYEGTAPGDYVSMLIPPESHIVCQNGIRTRWTGMVSSKHICTLLEILKNYITSSTHKQGAPWIAVTIWGFEDSPISWRTNEHGWLLSGDNHYTLVLFSNFQYWCMQSMSTHDFVQ